tara:strand:- start:285 stop:1406 length:1122 start_codon:yes stop_codon:yes gene_type:complete
MSIPNIINLKALYDFNNFELKNDIWYVKNVKLHNILFSDKDYGYIEFVNNNKTDFRLNNIKFKDYLIEEPNNFQIIEKGNYLKLTEGKYSGQIRNMYWKVKDNNNTFYLMSCKDTDKKTTYFKFDVNSLEKVLNVYKNNRYTWHIGKNGYVKTSYLNEDGKKINRYLHQHLMDYYGNRLNKNTKTIDHINRDKLDNRIENLRLATQSEQNINTNKRKRKKNAKKLPDGLTQDMIPKYVVYYNECYNKEKDLYREYFKIEKNPKYDGIICGSKSNKLSIQDKLEEIKGYLKKIEETTLCHNGSAIDKDTIKEEKKLPVGIRLKVHDKGEHLILDYRKDDVRYGLKMKCNSSKTFDENYEIFKNKVTKKYPEYKI